MAHHQRNLVLELVLELLEILDLLQIRPILLILNSGVRLPRLDEALVLMVLFLELLILLLEFMIFTPSDVAILVGVEHFHEPLEFIVPLTHLL